MIEDINIDIALEEIRAEYVKKNNIEIYDDVINEDSQEYATR